MENVRIDLFPDDVYVFTPAGEIKTLPKGATPVDFAYSIHTEVGNQCAGAKVNGRLMPLQYKLKTGDAVSIVTQKKHHPSKDWLNFVKTVKARSRIRQWIKTQEKDKSIIMGREMCEKAFHKHRLNFNVLLKSDEMLQAAEHFGFKTTDDLIASIGYGKITPLQIVNRFAQKGESKSSDESLLNKLMGRVRKKKPQAGVIVKGIDDVLLRFGKCCQPVPGDAITGYITRGYGITVHRASCVNALKVNPDRQIDVEWSDEITETYPVQIRVRAYDRVGLLADIAEGISKNGSNILNATTETNNSRDVESYFTITVEGTDHLRKVLSTIKKVKHVQEVRRIS